MIMDGSIAAIPRGSNNYSCSVSTMLRPPLNLLHMYSARESFERRRFISPILSRGSRGVHALHSVKSQITVIFE